MIFSRRRHLATAARACSRATVLWRKQDPEATPFLEDAVERYPEVAELHVLLGIQWQTSRRNEAAEHFRRAVALAGDDEFTLLRSALGLFHAGKVDEAQALAYRTNGLIGSGHTLHADNLNLNGWLAIERDDLDEAERLFRDTLVNDPDTVVFSTDLARLLTYVGRLPEALEILDSVKSRDPEQVARISTILLKDYHPASAPGHPADDDPS